MNVTAILVWMVALAQMVSTVILVSVLVATLAQHVRQVCIIHDVKKHDNPQFMSTLKTIIFWLWQKEWFWFVNISVQILMNVTAIIVWMVALARMVSTVILVSALVATLAQHARQVYIILDLKSHNHTQFMSTFKSIIFWL